MISLMHSVTIAVILATFCLFGHQAEAAAVIRKPAPAFSAEALMPDGSFKNIKLSDYKGKWFSDRAKDFAALNTQVIASSVDSKFSHLAWTNQDRKKGGLGLMDIPLLADINKEIARDYGVLIEEGEDAGVAFRGVFIIDPQGTLRQVTINDLPVGRNVDETMRLVQAFQFADSTGEVAPCGWKPGARGMKPDPKGSLEWFEAEL